MSEIKNIISLGLGVQSTAMYIMSSRGELPRADLAVCADPGKEKTATWKYFAWLKDWAEKNNGIEIQIIQDKNLYEDLLKSENSTGERFASIPAFTVDAEGQIGMLRRQCTNEYKIEQVDQAIRRFHGLKYRQRNIQTNVWKGITLDEIERMSIPNEKWKVQIYPFIGYKVSSSGSERLDWPNVDQYKMTRADVVAWFQANGFPIPPKSSCVFCPYQSDHAWHDLKTNHPEDFAAAVRVDKAIRNGVSNVKLNNPAFLHRSCKPLEEIEFEADAPDLWFGECKDDCHL